MAPRLCAIRATLISRSSFFTSALALATIAWASSNSLADEGGIGFWLTGQFGCGSRAQQRGYQWDADGERRPLYSDAPGQH